MGEHEHTPKHTHKHGSMDITEQEKAFAGFIKAGIILVVVSIGTLIFLALVNS
jgi:hypothetical protein